MVAPISTVRPLYVVIALRSAEKPVYVGLGRLPRLGTFFAVSAHRVGPHVAERERFPDGKLLDVREGETGVQRR